MDLGIPSTYASDTGLPIYTAPNDLVSIGTDIFGRPQMLSRIAAEQWQSMRTDANSDNIVLQVVSAYRSVDYQMSLITKKLSEGHAIEDILRTNAAPGHSQHHSGKALDLTTNDCKPLCVSFEETAAFQWLAENGSRYGFDMSYPQGNKWGIDYEPWHWCCNRVCATT